MECPLKFSSMPGFNGRCNDLLYCAPKLTSSCDVVVFFGGDIQDFGENMESHQKNKSYLEWSLESTAELLRNSFTNCHIVVVRPSKMEYKTFSRFDNFVPSGSLGVPKHCHTHQGLQHLELLLESLSQKLHEMCKDDTRIMGALTTTTDYTEAGNDQMNSAFPRLHTQNIKLVGFSKGCVVLNQFLYEFHHLNMLKAENTDAVSKIKDMYWLDGGHSGERNTWVTSKPLLDTLSQLGIRVHIHLTPYQIQDARRPWIAEEEKIFYETLCQLDAPVVRIVHFQDIPPSIEKHFNILSVFKQNS